MDVSYRQLKIFLALAETKNATRAAERVHLTQSAVSQAIKKLNAQLACELFLRQQNEFLLTDAGKSLYQEANIMVAKLAQLRAHNLAQKKGFQQTLSISALYTLAASIVPATIFETKQAHPGLMLTLKENRVANITAGVLNGSIDVGISTDPQHPDIAFTPIFRDHLCFVCPRSHLLSHFASLHWEDAFKHALIAVKEGNSIRDLVNQAFTAKGLTYAPEYQAAQTATLLAMIKSGLGCAILSSTIAFLHHTPELCFIPITNPITYREIGLLCQHSRSSDPLITLFQDKLMTKILQWDAAELNFITPSERPQAGPTGRPKAW
ncbi:MAG: LysR family transcriptional regulator [Neisseriaceae bacterium]|nr:LysR family transcriptional regulator [Neisseriaceae bacterium]MBP6861526.1 LysR family transcriptional regulator [Neisseriaceae bacterium]